MAFLSRGVLATLFLVWMTVLGLAADRAIIVLDASGSMWGQIDGRPKVDIARETLRTVLQSVPADMELGLMAYGHREKGSCVDIELVVPPAAGSAPAITAAADTMKFLGKTPLTAAVRQAAEALRYTEEKSTVILITDGIETCEADPCALGKELEVGGCRLHRPCRRLRPDRGRGQGGRLPGRKHRRQISAGVRRGSACGCADGDGRRAAAGRGSARA